MLPASRVMVAAMGMSGAAGRSFPHRLATPGRCSGVRACPYPLLANPFSKTGMTGWSGCVAPDRATYRAATHVPVGLPEPGCRAASARGSRGEVSPGTGAQASERRAEGRAAGRTRRPEDDHAEEELRT